MSKPSIYSQRGVSSDKKEVHDAIKNLNKGIFPGAFCKILSDPESPEHCRILHADTAGTKPSLAYLYSEESGKFEHYAGIAADAAVMNLDDVACVGAIQHLLLSQTIGRNALIVTGRAIEVIINGAEQLCQMLRDNGISCEFAGGETADVGNIVRTLDVGSNVFVRMKKEDVIDAGNIDCHNLIIGFSSTGQASWEICENSGMGSNGLTNGIHDALNKRYRKRKETYSPEIPKKLIYRGKYLLEDPLPGDERFTIGEALLSPTRTYLPLIKRIIEEIGRENIKGIIHCSGGGQTKIGKFGKSNNLYVKDNPFPIPPLFQMLKDVRGMSWKDMYECYNMGWRLEIAVPDDRGIAHQCIRIAESCGIASQIVGDVRWKSPQTKHRVVIVSPHGTFEY